MTSATLTNSSNGDVIEQYSYFINNIGFPLDNTGYLSEPKQSPFNYNQNTLLYYCSDLPHPTKERDKFLVEGTHRLIKLLNISNGKALVLFTAKTDLEEVYKILSQSDLPFNVLTQQKNASQEKILEAFRNDTNSVLLGTGAYWEGINIEGVSLSNLIIFRLPFPVPDPIIEYKCSIVTNPLMDVRVPEMIIKLKQGIGRLIRSSTDKGIVSIIDPRLGDKSNVPYKDEIWNSIPIKNRTNSIERLSEFYNEIVI